MSNDKTIKYQVSAENQGFVKAMEETAAAAVAAGETINAAFGSVGAAFGAVMSHIGAIAAVLAGGAVFGKGIEATKELTNEAVKLSKALGVSTEAGSILNVALRSIGSSADVYADANAKLVRQVRTNEDAVKAMGVTTRGANGEFLNGKQLMDSALKALASYKEGTDRNLAGQALFGKGAAEVTALLKLNNAVMEEAARKAEALGLVIGPEQAANTKAYKEAMEDVHLVLTAIENAIGQAVMPVFTQLAQWFAGTGPAVVAVFREAMSLVVEVMQMVIDGAIGLWGAIKEVFSALGSYVTNVTGVEIPGGMQIWRNAMDIVRLAALALKTGIEIVFEFIRGEVLGLMANLRTFAAVAIAAFHLDWEGAKQAWRDGTKEVESIIAQSQQRILDKTAANAAAMVAILNGEKPAAAPSSASTPKPSGTRSYVDPNTSSAGELAKARFAVIRAQLEGELALQREYLKEAQEIYDDAYKHNQITVQQFFAAKLAIEQQDLRSSIAIKQEELREVQTLENNKKLKEAERLALKAQEIRIVSQLAVLNAQLANTEIKNARELNNELTKKRDRLLEIERVSNQRASESQVNLDRIAAAQRLGLKQITDAQYLQLERGFEQRMYEIELKAQRDRYATIDNDPEERLRIDKAIEAVHLKHAENMAKIDKDIALESAKFTLDAQRSIEDAGVNFLTSLGDRTKTFKDKMLDLAKSIEGAFEQLIAKKFAQQLFAGFESGGGAGWLGTLFSNIGLPSFDVGTPYVPHDMVATIHRGERIVPADENAAGNFGSRSTNVTNHFHFAGAVDTHTQMQVMRSAGRGIQAALSRNG
jgi:hypothetical protein